MAREDRCTRCGLDRAEVRAGRGRHGGTEPCRDPANYLTPSSAHARWFTEAYNAKQLAGNARHQWLRVGGAALEGDEG
jgi:hypothetical protein